MIDHDTKMILYSKRLHRVEKYMLGLPRYNDIFDYITAISLYREFRYNDVILLLPWHIVISGLHCSCQNLFIVAFEMYVVQHMKSQVE